jgi:hypothetical protein
MRKGKWYQFLGEPRSLPVKLFAFPDLNSQVLALIPGETMVFFIEFLEKPVIVKPNYYGELCGSWKMLKVGYQDMFGWMAIYYNEEEFPAHRHFKLLY